MGEWREISGDVGCRSVWAPEKESLSTKKGVERPQKSTIVKILFECIPISV
jgi:hypothetical protein